MITTILVPALFLLVYSASISSCLGLKTGEWYKTSRTCEWQQPALRREADTEPATADKIVPPYHGRMMLLRRGWQKIGSRNNKHEWTRMITEERQRLELLADTAQLHRSAFSIFSAFSARDAFRVGIDTKVGSSAGGNTTSPPAA